MCVDISRCVWGACVCRSVHMWRPRKDINVFSGHPNPCIPRELSFLQGLMLWTTLKSHIDPGTLFPHLCPEMTYKSPAFYVSSGDLKFGPHPSVASSLPKEPSPWPLKHHLYHTLLHLYFRFASFTAAHTSCSSFRGPWASRKEAKQFKLRHVVEDYRK